jgi:hypothetical protein
MRNITLSKLPGNFRDAVSIIGGLGIQYLWIGSCVIREGDNKQDFGREIAKMEFIYQNAWLIIATVSSQDSNVGCFVSNRWPDVYIRINDSNGRTHVTGACRLD